MSSSQKDERSLFVVLETRSYTKNKYISKQEPYSTNSLTFKKNIETNFLYQLKYMYIYIPKQLIKSKFMMIENTRYLNCPKIFTDR